MASKKRADISIIIPCFNAGRFLSEAVQSVVDSTAGLNVELVIVDDGSTDKGVDSIPERIEHVATKIIRLPLRGGVQRARNAGLASASGEFVMTLDADDMLSEPATPGDGFVNFALRALENPNVAFVHAFSEMFEGYDGLTISAYPLSEKLVARKHHVPTSIIYRREELSRGTLYFEGVQKWQDWAFGVEILANRWKHRLSNLIVCTRSVGHKYRVHSEWDRISELQINEVKMTSIVVQRHVGYFRYILNNDSSYSEIAKYLCSDRPSRLIDLLHMASFDLSQALTIAQQRSMATQSPYDELGIP